MTTKNEFRPAYRAARDAGLTVSQSYCVGIAAMLMVEPMGTAEIIQNLKTLDGAKFAKIFRGNDSTCERFFSFLPGILEAAAGRMAQWEERNPRPRQQDFSRRENFEAVSNAWTDARKEYREGLEAEAFISVDLLGAAARLHKNSPKGSQPGPRCVYGFAYSTGFSAYSYTPGAEYGADHCGVG